MPKAKRRDSVDELPSIAAAREPRKRVSSKPKRATIEKFIRLLDASDAEKSLMLVAAALWYELRLVLDAEQGPRAITYGERVNQSSTHMAIQGWMARAHDKLKVATTLRHRTGPKARERLDLMIVCGCTIEECAEAQWGQRPPSQSAIKRMRTMISENIVQFAALACLPGAN